MKIIKKTIVEIANNLGFDIVRKTKSAFFGLDNFSINSIIDIGANRGQFVKKILKMFPGARIYFFEPLPLAMDDLKKWTKEENINRANFFNVALGDKEGDISMFYHVDHDDSSSLLETTDSLYRMCPLVEKQEKTMVKMTTLDKAIKELEEPLLPEIIIKVDVEGYEDRVIIGGRETFKRTKSCILEICLDELHKNQPSFSKIFSLMSDLGFDYAGNIDQFYAPDGHIIYINALFIKRSTNHEERKI